MTATPVAPAVELRFNPTDLRPADIPKAGAFLGSPAQGLEAGLAAIRGAVIAQAKDQVRGIAEPTHGQLIRILDLAWQAAFWRFRKISAPVIADAYIRAYREADAGDVPMSVIYDLAEKHAEKTGEYFHDTSRAALSEGFNALVNRRIPARAAADRVLDAYGLTPRQMRGYTSAKFDQPVTTTQERPLRAQARAYIDKSFTTRMRTLSTQEEHNIDQQAKQLAWMWLQDKGRLGDRAQKMWLTARDEKVCPVCGPLHGKKVGINEKFVTKEGEFYSPGLHPNCRCQLRLIENRYRLESGVEKRFGVVQKARVGRLVVAKADEPKWNPKLHPRGGDPKNKGRFSRRSVTYQEPETDIANLNRFLAEAEAKHRALKEEKKEQPEKISAEEKISAGPRIGAEPKIGLERKIGLESPIGLGEEKIGVERPKISREEIADRIKLTPEAKLKLVGQTEKILAEALPTYQRPRAKERKLYYKPTVWLHDATGKERPYFAVEDWDTPTDGTNYELHHDIHFTPNLGSIAHRVVEMREEKVVDAIDSIVNQNWDNPIVWHPTEHAYFSADLTFENMAGPIRWLANGKRPADDMTETIEWVDRAGNRHPQTHKYSEIIDMMGDRAKALDLEVRVMRLDEAHNSWKGQTVHHRAGTFQGKESWVTEGFYTVKKKTKAIVHSEPGRKIGTTIVSLDPEIEEVELPSMFE